MTLIVLLGISYTLLDALSVQYRLCLFYILVDIFEALLVFLTKRCKRLLQYLRTVGNRRCLASVLCCSIFLGIFTFIDLFMKKNLVFFFIKLELSLLVLSVLTGFGTTLVSSYLRIYDVCRSLVFR